ncbi:MAG: exosome complex RNA-binding protein Csl4, partial [Candidatus Nezhaarchaeales archaeon]
SEKILKDVVIPGEEIGVIEEFLPGDWTYVDGNSIRSMIFGTAILDINEKRVKVRPLHRMSPLIIEKGDIVIGEVIGMRKDVAAISIRKVENKGLILSNPWSGLLHVSQVSDKFIDFLSDAVKVTDILRARVINLRPPYQLSIKERGMGVILAFCPICQNPMSIKNKKLYCLRCKIREERKISTRYSINLKL